MGTLPTPGMTGPGTDPGEYGGAAEPGILDITNADDSGEMEGCCWKEPECITEGVLFPEASNSAPSTEGVEVLLEDIE